MGGTESVDGRLTLMLGKRIRGSRGGTCLAGYSSALPRFSGLSRLDQSSDALTEGVRKDCELCRCIDDALTGALGLSSRSDGADAEWLSYCEPHEDSGIGLGLGFVFAFGVLHETCEGARRLASMIVVASTDGLRSNRAVSRPSPESSVMDAARL